MAKRAQVEFSDDPLISDSDSEIKQAEAKKKKIDSADAHSQKKQLPSFSQLASSSTAPKFLTQKREPDFISKVIAAPQAPPPKPVQSDSRSKPKPKPSSHKEDDKLQDELIRKVQAQEKEAEAEEEGEGEEEPAKSYEESLKQIESSNKIYKKVDRLEAQQKLKNDQKNHRRPRRPMPTQLAYQAEAYHRLTHSLDEFYDD